MSPDTRRAALVRNLELAEAGGYTYIVENNRRLLATLDAQEAESISSPMGDKINDATPPGAPTKARRAQQVRALLWSWLMAVEADLPEEVTDELQRERALQLLRNVREAQATLDDWSDRLIRIASEHGATNPDIGEAVGVGKERIRRRLLREPGAS